MFGRVGRSASTVVIAGALCFAVPVAGAQALVGPSIIGLVATIATEGGAGLVAAPEAAAAAGAVCATGVGCAVLGAAAVGVGLYLTQDTWVPWVKNAFGDGNGPSVHVAGCGARFCLAWQTYPDPNLRADNGVGSGFQVLETLAPGSSDTTTPDVQFHFTCRDTFGDIWTSGRGAYWPGGNGTVFTVPGCGNGNYHGDWQPGAIIGVTTTYGQPQDNQSFSWSAPSDPITADNTTISNQVDCVNPDGSTFEVTQAVNGVTGDLAPLPTCAGAPGSQAGAHGRCVTTSAGPVGGSLVVQSSNCAAATTLEALYPNCVGGGVACTYVVSVDGLRCTVGAPACAHWAETYVADPARVTCHYGEYLVGIAACSLLERLYEVRTSPVPATVANTDGRPETYDAPGPRGQVTSQLTPGPDPAPKAPQPTPNPSTAPNTIGSPQGPQTQQENECWPSGWGMFNPASWVMQPVKCALAWAFVPRASVLSGLAGGASSDLSTAGIAPIAGAVGANFALIGQGTGCDGPGVTFAAVGVTKALHPFSACTSPMSTLATISYALSTVGIVGVGGFAALRAVGSGFGFNVSMGRGKAEGS